MNQEQNNLNPNNFNTQGNNGIPNNQPLQNNQSFNNAFNQNVGQNPNVSGSTFNPQPSMQQQVQTQTIPSYEQPIMQEPAPQPMNQVDSSNANNQNFNNKPSKKMNLGLIIGIIAAVVIVGVGIIFGSRLVSNGENNVISKKISVNGKIPYNNSVSESANSNLIYKDNTRNLYSKTKTFRVKAGSHTLPKTIDYVDISIYLNTDETEVVSYSWKENETNGYEFLEFYIDDSNKHYLYTFINLSENSSMIVTSKNIEVAKKLKLSNKQTIIVGNEKLYKGYFGNLSAYQYIQKKGDLEYSLIYVTSDNDMEKIVKEIQTFDQYVSLDNGSPFISDYMIRNLSISGLNVNSYKYVSGAVLVSPLSGRVAGIDMDVDYEFRLINDGIHYTKYQSNYYSPDEDINNKIGESVFNGNCELFASLDLENNILSIIIKKGSQYNKYYIDNYDSTKTSDYYLNNFNSMLKK